MNIDSQPITDFKIGDRNFMVSFYERRFDRLRKTGSELPLQYLHRLFAIYKIEIAEDALKSSKMKSFCVNPRRRREKLGAHFGPL